MLVRYSRSEAGKTEKRAEVYTAEEHGIRPEDIDGDAVKICRRLRSAGFSAYIVGGAVRDLLLGRKPTDFDLATDAHPNKIRKLFRNSRIIGKRFRLVHIFFHNKIIEVSTFRSDSNNYGSIEEDVVRRDFSFNALYYCPIDGILLDYIGGLKDIRQEKLVPLIDLGSIFTEDAVRMIRALRYSEITGFELPQKLKRKIRKSSSLLSECPPSRMTEEIFKILKSGRSEPIVRSCYELGLLPFMLPRLNDLLSEQENGEFKSRFFENLKILDEKLVHSADLGKGKLLVGLLREFIRMRARELEHNLPHKIFHKDLVHQVKGFIRPMVPANKDIDYAISTVIGRKVHRPQKKHGRHFRGKTATRQFSSKAHPPFQNNRRD